jgi:hypothetical protein
MYMYCIDLLIKQQYLKRCFLVFLPAIFEREETAVKVELEGGGD